MDSLRRTPVLYRRTADNIIAASRELVESSECSDMHVAILASLLHKMGVADDRAVAAAKHGHSIEGALRYLLTARFVTCDTCARELEPFMMFQLCRCGYELCKSCCKSFFSVKIRNEPVLHLTCYKCEAEIDVTNICHQLKIILDSSDYDLLEKKLLEANLRDEKNFKYCPKCNFGCIVDPTLRRPMCPSCKAIMCGKCWLVWADQHNNVSCEDFKRWKRENEPEFQEAEIDQILNREGIVCPHCCHRYSFAKGGCLHCICRDCKYEFCSCCKSQFFKVEDCGSRPNCVQTGLHAHHPRNCFYHVRDYPVPELINLIKENEHEVDETPSEAGTLCSIKVSDDSMNDMPCTKPVYKAHKCNMHFTEYLGELIFNNGIDTASLMNVAQLRSELAKNGKQIPEKYPSEDDATYCGRLKEIVMASLPIEQETAA